jgi:hypothetical protein
LSFCLLKKLFIASKSALPVAFHFRDLQNKICSTISTLSGTLTNAINSASFEISVLSSNRRANYFASTIFLQLDQSHLLPFLQFFFAQCCQRKGFL